MILVTSLLCLKAWFFEDISLQFILSLPFLYSQETIELVFDDVLTVSLCFKFF